jgi:hypothetical protein
MMDLVSYVVVKLFVEIVGLKDGIMLILLLAGVAFSICWILPTIVNKSWSVFLPEWITLTWWGGLLHQ